MFVVYRRNETDASVAIRLSDKSQRECVVVSKMAAIYATFHNKRLTEGFVLFDLILL